MAEEKKKKTQARRALGKALRTEGIVTVEVGEEHVKYPLHKSVLVCHSKYFTRALNGPWAEAEDRKVTLEDVEPGIFNVFVNYIYGQRIPRRGRPWLEVTEQKGGKAAAHLAPVKAICLADRLLATNFKEALHNSYVDGLVADSYVNNSIYAAVIYAFHHLPQDDPLLKFLIHAQSSYWKDSYVSAETGDHELLKELPHEFLCGVMTRMSELRGRKYADWGLYPCDYHLHKDEGEKEQCSAYKKQMGMKP